MIKNLWGKIAYYWFIFILIFVGFFVGNVNASEITDWSTNQTRLTLDQAGSSSFTDFYTAPHTFTDLSYPVKRVQFRVRASSGLSVDNTYTFTFGYQPNPDSISWGRVEMLKNGDSNYIEDNFTCGNVYVNNYGYYLTDCTLSPRYNYTSSDYLWVTIILNGNGGYQTSIRTYMFGYDERLGTNAVITNQTNNIINNNNANTQSIINNQNNNTQAIIDSNMSCDIVDKNKCEILNKYLNNTGSLGTSNDSCVSSYVDIHNVVDITILNNSAYNSYCFYNVNKTKISCSSLNSLVVGEKLVVPTSGYYIRYSIVMSSNRPQFKICKNGSQATTDSINDLNDNINDDSTEDPSEDFSDMEDMIATNGVITNLISLPVTLYTKVLNNINGTCSSQNLGSLYGTDLIIPCIDVDDYLGSTLWNTIDIIISGFFVWYIARKMIKVFNNFSSMKEGDVIGD